MAITTDPDTGLVYNYDPIWTTLVTDIGTVQIQFGITEDGHYNVRVCNNAQYDRQMGRNNPSPNGVTDVVVRGVAHIVDGWFTVKFPDNGSLLPDVTLGEHVSFRKAVQFSVNNATPAARKKISETLMGAIALFCTSEEGHNLLIGGRNRALENRAFRDAEKVSEARNALDDLEEVAAESAEALRQAKAIKHV